VVDGSDGPFAIERTRGDTGQTGIRKRGAEMRWESRRQVGFGQSAKLRRSFEGAGSR
jgi:hypothetical protein